MIEYQFIYPDGLNRIVNMFQFTSIGECKKNEEIKFYFQLTSLSFEFLNSIHILCSNFYDRCTHLYDLNSKVIRVRLKEINLETLHKIVVIIYIIIVGYLS